MKKNRLLENYYKLSREQRIQWKKYLCVLGTAFLLFLLLINLLHSCGREEPGARETEEALPQHIPVVRELKNVWITEAEAGQITLFCDGVRETYDLDTEANEAGRLPTPDQMREQLADVELTDDLVRVVTLKTE